MKRRDFFRSLIVAPVAGVATMSEPEPLVEGILVAPFSSHVMKNNTVWFGKGTYEALGIAGHAINKGDTIYLKTP